MTKGPTADLPEGTPFERAGCVRVAGEKLFAARARGRAAECVQDAAELLRQGDIEGADDLLAAARLDLARYRLVS
jgi:hypothetical protein